MITLLHGEEEFTRSEALAEVRAQVLNNPGLGDLNLAVLTGPVDLRALRLETDTLPFLGEQRLVIVHNWLSQLASELGRGSASARETAQALADYLPTMPESTHLVFVEEKLIPSNHPVMRVLQDMVSEGKAHIRAFTLPSKARERRDFVLRWLRDRARSLNVELDPQAATLLADILGTNLRLLNQELEKLRTYVGAGGYISPEAVHQIVPYTHEASIFDMLNAIGDRNPRRAVRLLQQALQDGQHPLQILALIARQYRIYIGLKDLAEQGMRPEEMARRLRIPAWTVRRDLKVAQRMSWAFLERVMQRLLETDASIKQGQMDADIALQLLVTGLSMARGK